MTSVVYFAECDGQIKIGFTKNLSHRLVQFATGNPKPVKIIGTIHGGKELEHRIHEALSIHRVRNEWFEDCEEVREALTNFQKKVERYSKAKKALLLEAANAPSSIGMPTSSLAEIDARFHKLLHNSLLDRLTAAVTAERARDLPDGALTEAVLPGRFRRSQFLVAIDMLIAAHTEYGGLLDSALIDPPDNPTSISLLYSKASSLIIPCERALYQFGSLDSDGGVA